MKPGSKFDPEDVKLQDQIRQLKAKLGLQILAHFYQRPEIQAVADMIGDSLELAKQIQGFPPHSKIIYAAVDFMAECGAVLNPESAIYFPVSDANCPMAKFGTVELIKKYREEHPKIPIVLYINSQTEAKQYADVICTSSSALQICKRIQQEFNSPKIAFGPDKNLAHWVSKQTGIQMDLLPENGHCFVHDQFTPDHVSKFRATHPDAKVVVHPECPPAVVDLADFVGSTKAMYNYILEHPKYLYGIGTEVGLIDYIKSKQPGLQILPLKDNAVCFSMKKFTLEAILYTLQHLDEPGQRIQISPQLRQLVLKPLQKMFELAK